MDLRTWLFDNEILSSVGFKRIVSLPEWGHQILLSFKDNSPWEICIDDSDALRRLLLSSKDPEAREFILDDIEAASTMLESTHEHL